MHQPATSLKPRILLAPLDWGLGHATRCIPVISRLIEKNCDVLLAGEGEVKRLLATEFPQLTFVNLKGYHVQYSKRRWLLPLAIGQQIPKIISTIKYENQRLQEIVKEHNIDGVISDNRYGFYHRQIPSVFITHQLSIQTPFGRWASQWLQSINYKFINRFSECWVPDEAEEPSLAGALSHAVRKPAVPVRFLGPLSRFRKEETSAKQLLILLSGPEPQRTILENIFIEQLSDYAGAVVLVRGLPGSTENTQAGPNIQVHAHLSAEELNHAMNEASMVISRCGYSTVMDLAVLQKKSILIPTPGQTEQEYLARHLMQNNFALCIAQEKFKLKNALELANSFDYHPHGIFHSSALNFALDSFIESIQLRKQ